MSTNQIKEFGFTWNYQDSWDQEEFKKAHEVLQDTLRPLCSKYVFQLERGEQGRLHYQGYFVTNSRIRLQTLAPQLQATLHGIHLSVGSAAGRMALKHYCMKKDTRVEGPWSDGGRLPETALEDVIQKPFDGFRKYAILEDEKTRRPFQESLRLMTRATPDDRSIVWLCDQTGNSGKTLWARWMSWKYGAAFHTYGSTKDVVNLIVKEGARRTYIFNLPRSRPKESFMCDLFNTLENLKDGSLINQKYEVSRLEMDSPHVMVMANFYPSEEERKHLSQDRWQFYRINKQNWELCAMPQNLLLE